MNICMDERCFVVFDVHNGRRRMDGVFRARTDSLGRIREHIERYLIEERGKCRSLTEESIRVIRGVPTEGDIRDFLYLYGRVYYEFNDMGNCWYEIEEVPLQ